MSDVTAPGPTVDAPRYRSRRRFWLKAALLALVLLFGVPGFMFWRAHRAEVRRVEAMLESIRQRGEPTTPEELTAFYRAGLDDHDSTGAWLDAFALEGGMAGFGDLVLPIFSEDAGDLPAPGEPWPERPAVEAFLAKNSAYLAKIEAAVAAGGEVRFPIKFADGINTLLLHVDSVRECSRMLAAAALVDIHSGDGAAAANRIDQLFATADLLDGEPILVSMLVRLACESVALSVVREAAAAGVLSDDQTRALQARLRSREYDSGLRRVLCGERALLIYEHGRVKKGTNPPGVGMPAGPALLHRPFYYADLALTLTWFDGLIQVADKSAPERLAALEQHDIQFRNFAGAATPWEKYKYLLTLLMFPAGASAIKAVERANVARDATDAILAIELYRRAHGNLPPTLAALAPDFLPAVPADRFDGQPLRYRVEGDEAIVWSVGYDQADGGGNQKSGTFDPDIVFRLRFSAAGASLP